jgi:DNA-binding NarL/FixJ family response regulator
VTGVDGGIGVRLVVVGIDGRAAERLRPYCPALTHFGFTAVAVPRGGLLPVAPGPIVVVVVIPALTYHAIQEAKDRCPEATVVAIVEAMTPGRARLALGAGADGVVSWDDDPHHAIETVWGATRGFIRADVVALLGERPLEAKQEERHWLTLLAGGMTVAAVAREVHRSQGDLRRRLGHLYQSMGVEGMREALLEAQRQHWIE